MSRFDSRQVEKAKFAFLARKNEILASISSLWRWVKPMNREHNCTDLYEYACALHTHSNTYTYTEIEKKISVAHSPPPYIIYII